MRQSLVERGLIDTDYRLTAAGNDYAAAIIKRLDERSPRAPKVLQCVKEQPMPRSMGDPNYKYRPLSAEQRQKQSESQRARLGIPAGHCRIYGVHVPLQIADKVRPLATEIAGKQDFEAAHAFVQRLAENEWRIEAEHAPMKVKQSSWTPERRKAASEASKARWAARRAREQEEYERQKNSAESRLSRKLVELREQHERARAAYWRTKEQIDELEEVQKKLAEVKTALNRYGLLS